MKYFGLNIDQNSQQSFFHTIRITLFGGLYIESHIVLIFISTAMKALVVLAVAAVVACVGASYPPPQPWRPHNPQPHYKPQPHYQPSSYGKSDALIDL